MKIKLTSKEMESLKNLEAQGVHLNVLGGDDLLKGYLTSDHIQVYGLLDGFITRIDHEYKYNLKYFSKNKNILNKIEGKQGHISLVLRRFERILQEAGEDMLGK